MNPADEQPQPTTPGDWAPKHAAGTGTDTGRPPLGKLQLRIAAAIATGVAMIATIGYTGSYSAVTGVAVHKGFGWFSYYLTVGVDAGITVFLALDLFLTWLRIPYPLLRYGAWMLTVATIVFNASASWPDPIGVGMHAVIPILFVISMEAARHTIRHLANIAAKRHMENPRLVRWVLAFPSTFRIWRRQRLWELRSYEDVIAIERDAAQYREALRAQHGRGWRSKAGPDALLALRLARYGTPIAETLARLETEARRDQTRETAETETSRRQSPRESRPTSETGTKPAETTRETRETKPAETGLAPSTGTKVSQVTPETGARETAETTAVAIGDRETEIRALISLMEERGDAMAVSLNDAIETTGCPKSTAAKRLAAARDRYRKSA